MYVKDRIGRNISLSPYLTSYLITYLAILYEYLTRLDFERKQLDRPILGEAPSSCFPVNSPEFIGEVSKTADILVIQDSALDILASMYNPQVDAYNVDSALVLYYAPPTNQPFSGMKMCYFQDYPIKIRNKYENSKLFPNFFSTFFGNLDFLQ